MVQNIKILALPNNDIEILEFEITIRSYQVLLLSDDNIHYNLMVPKFLKFSCEFSRKLPKLIQTKSGILVNSGKVFYEIVKLLNN